MWTGRHQSGVGAESEELVRETRQLMLQRSRVAIHLGWSIHLAFVGVDVWRIAPGRYSEAVVYRVAGTIALWILLALTRTRYAERWAAWIGCSAVAVMMLIVAAIMPLFDGASDPHYAIQGTGMVLCVLGAGLLLPLDGAQMLGLGVLALALHVGFTWTFPLSANLPILVATASSVLIATVGARELARSRRAAFQGRRAQEELLRARSDFVAMLTHDIRNPMAVIDGYVDMLLAERELTPKARDELLIQVQRAARTALELAGEFLDASKIEAGRFLLKPTRTVDVDDVLRRVLGDHRSHATQRGIALWHDEAPDLPAIEADAAALARVFTNLVGNAIKHTSAGGSVRVAARRAGSDRIEVVVEDTGEGLPPGMESRVFDRYTGVATRADSTGLGLFIASTITAAHGGTIAAENRRDRRGARFLVVLPVTTVVDVSASA